MACLVGNWGCSVSLNSYMTFGQLFHLSRSLCSRLQNGGSWRRFKFFFLLFFKITSKVLSLNILQNCTAIFLLFKIAIPSMVDAKLDVLFHVWG